MKDKTKKILIFIVVTLAVIYFLGGAIRARTEQIALRDKEKLENEQKETSTVSDGADSALLRMQPELIKTYGKLPEGFIWESNGDLLSLGDKDMSAEDVVYAYFRGLSSLDISTVERYSRHSSVVSTYGGYFDEKNKNTDYMDQFIRNMYRECLLSLQVVGIDSESVFAENKKVYTVKAKMLDLTNKDFWKKDQDDIFKALYLYDSDESDSAKSDIYLFDYILNYYKSEEAELRDVTFDITVQKYPDLDSGWLVSIDSDVNDACKYKDGKLVVSYIRDMYRNTGRNSILNNLKEDLTEEEVIEEEITEVDEENESDEEVME